MANSKMPKITGHTYIMLKMLETSVIESALSEPFTKALRDLESAGFIETPSYEWQGQTFRYREDVKRLSESGRKLLDTIRGESGIPPSRLENEAKAILNSSELEVRAMWKRIFPNFAPK